MSTIINSADMYSMNSKNVPIDDNESFVTVAGVVGGGGNSVLLAFFLI